MTDTYTDADARFDAEEQGRCGVCGREVSQCHHCKECGRVGNNHAHYCASRTVQHIVTDKATGRTFNLVLRGKDSKELDELHELIRDGRDSRFAIVDTTTPDGAQWWQQWESEAEAGAFSPTLGG